MTVKELLWKLNEIADNDGGNENVYYQGGDGEDVVVNYVFKRNNGVKLY